MFHEEADAVAAAATTKAFINLFHRRYGEGGCFFIVKRTEADIIGSPFFQFYKTTDDLRDVNPTQNLLYGMLRDQEND